MAERAPLTVGSGATMPSWTESAPGETRIGPAEVHVWRFQLHPAPQRSPLLDVLAAYIGVKPLDVELATGPHGKPALASTAPGVHFNVSHSGSWGLVAVARVEVGVDVEQIRPRRASARLTDRFLTDGERRLLQSRLASHTEAAFFMIWSRKEAYLKAVGVGLSVPFSAVDSSRDKLPDLDAQGHQQTGSEPWIVKEFFVDELHPATVVARAAQISLTFLTFARSDA